MKGGYRNPFDELIQNPSAAAKPPATLPASEVLLNPFAPVLSPGAVRLPSATTATTTSVNAAEEEKRRVEEAKRKEEAARKRAAEEEAGRKRAAEEEAARKRAAEEEAARKRAAEEAARKKAAEEEAARKRAAEEEAARKRAVEEEAARKRAAEEEAARKKAAEEEAARKRAAEEEAARKRAAEEELARKKVEDEAAAARKKAVDEAAAARKKAEDAEKARQLEEENRRRVEAEARKRAEEEAASRKKEEEARLQREEEARKREEENSRRVQEEVRKKALADEEAKKAAEEEARKKAEREALDRNNAKPLMFDDSAFGSGVNAAVASTAASTATPPSVTAPEPLSVGSPGALRFDSQFSFGADTATAPATTLTENKGNLTRTSGSATPPSRSLTAIARLKGIEGGSRASMSLRSIVEVESDSGDSQEESEKSRESGMRTSGTVKPLGRESAAAAATSAAAAAAPVSRASGAAPLSRASGASAVPAEGDAKDDSDNDEVDLDALMAKPLPGQKIRIKLKAFEGSSDDEDDGAGTVIASGAPDKKPRAGPRVAALAGGAGGGGGTLSAPPGAASRRRKPVATSLFSPVGPDSPMSPAQVQSPSVGTPTTPAPALAGFGSPVPTTNQQPVEELNLFALPQTPANFASPSLFASPQSAVQATPPPAQANIVSSPPLVTSPLSPPVMTMATSPSPPLNQSGKDIARPPPPVLAPLQVTGVFVESGSKVPAQDLKKMFSQTQGDRRLPAFPEEAAFEDRKITTGSALRITEIFAGAIMLFDVKTVRMLLQIGLNTESPVEETHESSVKPLYLVGKVWLQARRDFGFTEQVEVEFNHTLGPVRRKAQMKEIVAICRLLLLKGAAVTQEMWSFAAELLQQHNDGVYGDLLTSYPTQQDLDALATFPAPPKLDEEIALRKYLKETVAVITAEREKEADPKAKAEAEKAYAKTLKKLPKAVVKFHKDRRIKPMYSPLLRKTEQMFLACALFDIIGILNYIQRGTDINAPLECWDGPVSRRYSALEVICKYWVQGETSSQRKILANGIVYSRDVLESDCVEALTSVMQAGGEVTLTARELAEGKGDNLASLLQNDKKGGVKGATAAPPSATNANVASGAAPAAAAATATSPGDQPALKRKITLFGKKDKDAKEPKEKDAKDKDKDKEKTKTTGRRFGRKKKEEIAAAAAAAPGGDEGGKEDRTESEDDE